MANPVTYNSGNFITGSLKRSVISVGISPQLNISGYNWRNGFEDNNLWVIYSDTYSMGQATQGNALPTIWATPVKTDQGLITLINSLSERNGQSAFTTLSDAVSWLNSQNKYFLSNQNYPPIVTDGLVFLVDAGFAASYPSVGTTAYDLGTQQFVNSIQNGTGWVNDNSRAYFDFDGADDQIEINSPNNFGNITWSAGVTVQVLYKIDAVTDLNGQFRAMIGTSTASRSFNYYLYGAGNPATTLQYHFSALYSSSFSEPLTITANKYHLATFRINSSGGQYLHNLTSLTTVPGVTPSYASGVNQFLGRADNLWKGNIANWKIYNKSLSDDELRQNYYQGPIVTSNLSYLWDASNLISYYNGSSTTFDLVSGGVNGTLQNGVTYITNYGGYWQFDGSDDKITLSSSITLGNGNTDWTVNAWIRTTSLADGLTANPILSNQNGGPIYGSFDTAQGYQAYWVYPSNINSWKKFQGNIFVADGEWHMLTYVNKSNYTMDFYVDGVYDTTVGPTNSGNNNPLDMIGSGLATYFSGDIAMVQVNQGTAFNQAQVTQQYGATRGKFQFYGALATGGSVSTITENGVSYRVHTFTSSGNLTVQKSGSVEVLVVAGGGGGSGNFYDDGAGGGGGGLIYRSGYQLTNDQVISVTIGAGGDASTGAQGGNGNNSVFDNLTAIGGGGGAAHRGPGISGGSGGGGSGSFVGDNRNVSGGAGTLGQGNRGGNGGIGDIPINGGGYPGSAGGGGAGQQGFPPTGGGTNEGGKGGDGVQISINGTPTYYAGGGGGVRNGIGGLGGGGTASFGRGGSPAGSGGVNTGGGGGGGRANAGETGVPGPGGSGIVIIRYRI